MNFEKCDKCNDYGWKQPCMCKPFDVIDEDGEEYTVYSLGEEDAALKFAKSSNEEGDYYLMNESVEITVNGSEYSISAEPDVHYSASKA